MLQIIIIAILSLLAQLILPWWSLALVAFGVCFWRSTGAGQSFWYGFAGIALVWLLYALLIHLRTDGILTNRMGQLIFKTDGAALPLLVTALLGGLVGGLAGVSGYYVRLIFQNQIANRTS
ncbi:hypothetical protein [Spirosoma montaniterrae]|uniref:Uncharacterized protein n=1 Tax=Spirosoma montaniterrae TaxID=1178516 RepID=A0A1P9X354_9BACT|nr:hypothetical protein [Spirosoma montaniterrae]AQG82070.1 hypothetical protein AWR27_23900 [Spirosoma montaniterrae]